MASSRKTEIRKIATGAVFSALGVLLLLIGSITDVLDLSFGAAAAMIAVFAAIEYKMRFALTVTGVTFILGMIVVPSKLAPILYLAVAGYALLKAVFERTGKIMAWILKLFYVNAVYVLMLVFAKWVFMIPAETLIFEIVTIIILNVTAVLFDTALTKIIVLYVFKYRKRLKIDKYLHGR